MTNLIKFLTISLPFILISIAHADDRFVLIKKDKRVTFTEDMHCINTVGANNFINKFKLCEEGCKIRLDAAEQLCDNRVNECNALRENDAEAHKEIIAAKNETIQKVKTIAVEEINKLTPVWWKYALVAAGGVVVGAGVSVGVFYAVK